MSALTYHLFVLYVQNLSLTIRLMFYAKIIVKKRINSVSHLRPLHYRNYNVHFNPPYFFAFIPA